MNIEENSKLHPPWKFQLSTEWKISRKIYEMLEKFTLILILGTFLVFGSSVLSDNVKKKDDEELVKVVPEALSVLIKNDSFATSTSYSSEQQQEDISGNISNDAFDGNLTNTQSKLEQKNVTKTNLNQTFPTISSALKSPSKNTSLTSLVKETRSSGSSSYIRDFMGKLNA
jgi:hypothetical protein